MLVTACLLLAAPTTAMKSSQAHAPLTLPRRAFFQAATASAAGLASSAHATASFLADAPELKPPPGKPPNAPPSGPLANTPLGYQVGGGPRPEAEVREIDRARYKAAAGAAPAKTASFLDGAKSWRGSQRAADHPWTAPKVFGAEPAGAAAPAPFEALRACASADLESARDRFEALKAQGQKERDQRRSSEADGEGKGADGGAARSRQTAIWGFPPSSRVM